MTRSTLVPQFSNRAAADIVRNAYGREVVIKPLDSYIDQNFMAVDPATGEQFVLKIANAAERYAELDLQNRAKMHLGKRQKAVRIPQVLPSIGGERIITVPGRGDHTFLVRLVTFLSGTFLAEIADPSPALLESLGGALAVIDREMLDFYHPAAFREHFWDLKRAHYACRDLSVIDDPARRRLVDYFLLQFEREVLPDLPDFRAGVLHNDGNTHNVLVQETSGQPTANGIIDFGDAVHSPLVCELAIGMTYAMLGRNDPWAAGAAVVGGYQKILPLTAGEIDRLFYLICARLCVSVVSSARQRRREPENEYISISEAPAWALLERCYASNPLAVRAQFREAAGFGGADLINGMELPKIRRARERHIGPSLSLAYDEPLHIVRGAGPYLFDAAGRTYLDCVNNVAHVGHAHPAIVRAAHRQMSLLNTNTRYLHENLTRYAERLTALLPAPLSVCFFVNSGSEANDLALRLAQTATAREAVIVVDGAYHGHTRSLIDLSPYKFNGPGGQGRARQVRVVPMPDVYRGKYRETVVDAGKRYAADVQAEVDLLVESGNPPGAFFCESLLGCGGQIVLPENYLREACAAVRAAGGLYVADEVQVGFGRPGNCFWGFELQDVVPDIVTMGKPMGNGHPLAAVVTTPAIAAAFANGMEYFNTYGGNPVSCAVGTAVLDVLKAEALQQNARETGEILLGGLRKLAARYPVIGDVRGCGLFLGIELVSDPEARTPDARAAKRLVEKARRAGVLLSSDGPDHNVIKIKPPLVFGPPEAARLLETFDMILNVP